MPGPRPAVLAAFAAMVVLIGLNLVAVRLSNTGLAPTWGAAFRFGVAAWLMAAYVVVRRIPLPHGRALVGAMLYGTLYFAAFFGFIYWGLVAVPASLAAVLNASVPLLTFLVAVLAGIERFRGRALAGAFLVIVGIAVLVGAGAARQAPLLRLAAIFAACLSSAAGTVVVKAFPRSHPAAINAVGMAVAFVLLLVASLLQDETWTLPANGRSGLALGYLVASSLVLFPLAVWVIGEWTASASSYAIVVSPLVTLPVAAVLLDESLGGRFAIAAALVAAGVYIGALRQPRATTD
ncbi:MAG TPA: EamA family transporter [Candidatus Thermoplasmatota archaeon]|nr:EamA family transporter [Candidatus Thermoplasmatota archaeon]